MIHTLDIVLVVAAGVFSSIPLYAVLRIFFPGMDNRSFLLAALLMTLVGAADLLWLNRLAVWALMAAADFFILVKRLRCSFYLAALGVAVWLAAQALFYGYLARYLVRWIP